MLLAPVVQVVLFASSLLLNEKGLPKLTEIKQDILPDIEILPVSFAMLLGAAFFHKVFSDGI